ncbi:type VI secretion system baseplate subunit TssE [Methylomonas sp. AM2-LC]|uniref:type VI secretion system baseplate subunit TssE n=1 Tax=Methylomonas sp. AM2-LC TaxID=3153301 RepID=UPI00326782EC
MAELLQSERLQPSLLDRLTDEDPLAHNESREQRVLSSRQLRQSVLRDLRWLLNTTGIDNIIDLTDYPFVANSVVNYGSPLISGVTLSGIDVSKIVRKVRQAIIDFEPRIIANTLKVDLVVDDKKMSDNALSFQIEGDLWAQPLPLHLYIRSDIDLETGEFTVKDLGF